MPRKTRVYWINHPTKPTECHSRRCKDLAVRNRLCSEHYTAWRLAGEMPPMPDYDRAGVLKMSEPPLKLQLDADVQEYRRLENDVAMLPADEPATLETLEAIDAALDENLHDLSARHAEAREPFEKGLERVDRWFNRAEGELKKLKKQSSDKIEVVRSTIRAYPPPISSGRSERAAERAVTEALRGGRGK